MLSGWLLSISVLEEQTVTALMASLPSSQSGVTGTKPLVCHVLIFLSIRSSVFFFWRNREAGFTTLHISIPILFPNLAQSSSVGIYVHIT